MFKKLLGLIAAMVLFASPVLAQQSSTRNTIGAENWVIEGATVDANETTVTATDPTADRTVTIPNSTFTVGTIEVTQAYGPTVADHVDSIFFIANREYTVQDIRVVWGTAEATGAMDVMVERLQGTEACAAGDDLLAAVVDATGTADTVADPALTATTANLTLSAGNRLCVDVTATPNEITELTVTVTLLPSS